jgi:hypothetical protein
MPNYKFKIGQTLFLTASLRRDIPGGAYIVTTVCAAQIDNRSEDRFGSKGDIASINVA